MYFIILNGPGVFAAISIPDEGFGNVTEGLRNEKPYLSPSADPDVAEEGLIGRLPTQEVAEQLVAVE